MFQKFRIFVQRHDNGTYTVSVPGIRHIALADDADDVRPAAPSLASHGLILEEGKDNVRQALAKWLAKADPGELNHYTNYREGQSLEKIELELRSEDRHGRKRRDKIRLQFSLLLTKQDDEQFLVSVPKLTSPPLSFFCYRRDELKETATRELAAYFSDHTLEELLAYEYQRQELLDEVEVSFTPLKPQQEQKQTAQQDDASFWALQAAGINLNARVKEGKLLRAYGREREVNEVVNILAGERNNSLLLVGASGVGKTALMHEVVRRLREDNVPAPLRKRQIWYTSPNQLIAGCSFVGEWQEKLQNIVDEVKKRRHLLLVDDVMGLIEAGRWSKGDENMAQLLKPFIADGTVVLIGECTPERYRVGENRDPGFLRLFRAFALDETNEAATLGILSKVAANLEREFNLRIEPGATEAAVELTRRFQPYRALPGKATAFLERAAADLGAAIGEAGEERVVLSRQQAVRAFARHTGLPEFILSDHLVLDPADIERHFAEQLIGQPDAVQAVVDLVTVIKAGLNDPQKPLGGFFFVGPTGVGKTEMAKTLAAYLFGDRDRIIRFDMSEYAEPYSVAKLIGSVHASDEGELTKRIRLQPFSVVLLDEFEKAHPSIFDVLLQVLGEGRLTDASGRTADFRSAIFLMTSNLGATAREQRRVGLRADDTGRAQDAHFREQVEGFFRPEFVNRIDKIVVFRALDRDAMRQIASRELAHLLHREGITRRNLLVEIDDEVMDLLLETGFSPAYGARPLKREIERRLIVPLARHLVAHRITGSQLIQIKRVGEDVQLFSTTLAAAKQSVKRPSGPLSADGGARKLDAQALLEGIAAVRRHLHDWAEDDRVREMENEYKKLLGRTRRRNFVNFGEAAHKTWTRIYQLERLTKRLHQLKERAEYLEEFAALAQRERSGRYEPDLAQNYADLCRDNDFLEIELLCAHLQENGQALLRLGPVGKTARGDAQKAWVLALATMYLRWARRKGYQFAVFVPTDVYKRWVEAQGFAIQTYIPGFEPAPPNTAGGVKPPWAEVKVDDFATLLKRLEALDLGELALGVTGINVYGFLKSEAGVHKLLHRDEDGEAAAPFQAAVVHVAALEADAPAREALAQADEEQQKRKTENDKPRTDAAPEVIRLYAPNGNRFVRDLRTQVQTTQVRDVLDGQLDEFMLAYLKADESAAAWSE